MQLKQVFRSKSTVYVQELPLIQDSDYIHEQTSGIIKQQQKKAKQKQNKNKNKKQKTTENNQPTVKRAYYLLFHKCIVKAEHQ